jgi:hypothetical protein
MNAWCLRTGHGVICGVLLRRVRWMATFRPREGMIRGTVCTKTFVDSTNVFVYTCLGAVNWRAR